MAPAHERFFPTSASGIFTLKNETHLSLWEPAHSAWKYASSKKNATGSIFSAIKSRGHLLAGDRYRWIKWKSAHECFFYGRRIDGEFLLAEAEKRPVLYVVGQKFEKYLILRLWTDKRMHSEPCFFHAFFFFWGAEQRHMPPFQHLCL